jgi:hypothetical protein
MSYENHNDKKQRIGSTTTSPSMAKPRRTDNNGDLRIKEMLNRYGDALPRKCCSTRQIYECHLRRTMDGGGWRGEG